MLIKLIYVKFKNLVKKYLSKLLFSEQKYLFNQRDLNKFRNDGYLVINSFIKKDECNQIINQIKKKISNGRHLYISPDKSDTRIFGAENISKEIKKIFSNKFLHNICENYLNYSILNASTMVNYLVNKKKNKGSGNGWHRDDINKTVKAMVYLNDVTLECGPIYLGKVKENFKIEQKRKELPQNYKEKGLNTIDEEFLEEKLTPMVGKAGDAIFFDTNSPHKAGIIKDNYSRKVLRFDFERPTFNPRQSKLTKIMKDLFS